MFFFKKNKSKDLKSIVNKDNSPLPEHIAIIMDGNGRWAQKRGMPRNMGHREGSNALKRIAVFCSDIGIRYLTVYAFSTENWSRPKSEVDTLMSLLEEFLRKADAELEGKNIKIKTIGDISKLSPSIQSEIKRVANNTKNNDGMTLVIALNYGGRDDILYAIRNIAKGVRRGTIKPDEINSELVTNQLYTAGIPDPDLLIRTSGEQRVSNFLLWQTAYTEFWYTDDLWPDFTKEHIIKAVESYQKRNRRFGGI